MIRLITHSRRALSAGVVPIFGDCYFSFTILLVSEFIGRDGFFVKTVMNNYKIIQQNVVTLLPSPMFQTLPSQNSASTCCIVGEVTNRTMVTIKQYSKRNNRTKMKSCKRTRGLTGN